VAKGFVGDMNPAAVRRLRIIRRHKGPRRAQGTLPPLQHHQFWNQSKKIGSQSDAY
jgi:hypothetical protein